jgi:hypothetical protein
MADERNWPVRIHSIQETEIGRLKDKYVEVRLRVERPHVPFDVPFLLPKDVDDASIIPLVRNYFHRSMKALAEQTASWELSEEDVQALSPATKSR